MHLGRAQGVFTVTASLLVTSCGGRVQDVPVGAIQDAGTIAARDATAETSSPIPEAGPPEPLEAAPPSNPLDPSPCLTGGNVWHLAFDIGDGPPGPVTLTDAQARFQAAAFAGTPPTTWIAATITGNSPLSEPDYRLEIDGEADSLGHPNTSLHMGTYTGADKSQIQDPGHPGLDVSGNGLAANTSTGTFVVSELVLSGTTLERLTVAFEDYWENDPQPISGCLHYEQAVPQDQ